MYFVYYILKINLFCVNLYLHLYCNQNKKTMKYKNQKQIEKSGMAIIKKLQEVNSYLVTKEEKERFASFLKVVIKNTIE